MKRDAKADLEMCEKATPGPWKQMGHLIRLDELQCKVKRPHDMYVLFIRAEDAEFTAVAREALPYWINEWRKASEEAERLRKALEAAVYAHDKHETRFICAKALEDPSYVPPDYTPEWKRREGGKAGNDQD